MPHELQERELGWPDFWPILAEIDAEEPEYRTAIHPCDCTAGPCDNAPEALVGGVRWLRCPYEALRNPYFLAAKHLARMQEVQPLDGWPHLYAAGVTSAMRELRVAWFRHDEAERKRQSPPL